MDIHDAYARYSNLNKAAYRRGQYTVEPAEGFDYVEDMEASRKLAERLRQRAVRQAIKNASIAAQNKYVPPDRIKFPGVSVRTRGGGNKLPAGKGFFPYFAQSIVGQESGGDIDAISSAGAMGKYQIMPFNILGPGGWDVQTIGRDVNKTAFLNNEKLQDRIALGKLREYFQLYGPAGAAATWYSGDPNRKNDYSHVSSGPSVGQYVDEVMQRARKIRNRRKR